MSTPDETRDIPVTDAAAEDDHEPTLVSVPAVAPGDWDLTRQLPSRGPAPAPEDSPARAPAIHCPGCGETFAGAGFGGRALFLADALRAAALTAGWSEDGGRWTCSVCHAGIAGPLYGPEREPAPPMPAPDTDPLDQSLAILAEHDGRRPVLWDEINRRNNVAAHKNLLRFRDGFQGFEALFSRTPDLRDDPEAAAGLLNYEAGIAGLAEDMHRESLERSEAGRRAFEERLAKLREPERATA